MRHLPRTHEVLVVLTLVLVWSAPARGTDEVTAGRAQRIEAPRSDALSHLSGNADSVLGALRATREQRDPLLSVGPFQIIGEQTDWLDQQLRQRLNIDLGVSYTALYQGATRNPRPTGGGKFDFFGFGVPFVVGDSAAIGIIGFEAGAWQVYTPTSPADLGGALGSLWPVTDDFRLQRFSLTQLYWENQIPGGSFAYRIGKVNQDDAFDNYRFKGVDFFFMNTAFATNPAIALPAKGLGILAAYELPGGGYLLGGAGDALASDTTSGFSTLFGEGKIFSAGEIGWAGSVDRWGDARIHATAWNSPAIPSQPAGWGIATMAEQEIGAGVFPFVRYAYGAGDATGVRHLASIGFGVEGPPERNDDVAGVAFAWGTPTDPDARSQVTGEIFYRLQLTRYIQLTPGYQVLIHPSTDPSVDLVGIFELRARVAF